MPEIYAILAWWRGGGRQTCAYLIACALSGRTEEQALMEYSCVEATNPTRIFLYREIRPECNNIVVYVIMVMGILVCSGLRRMVDVLHYMRIKQTMIQHRCVFRERGMGVGLTPILPHRDETC